MISNEKELFFHGQGMHDLAKELWPICRSITGKGVRQTLSRLQEELLDLKIYSVNSGTACFDWTVPDEWEIDAAYLENEVGEKVLDFKDNNLHVLGYSIAVDEWLELEDLQEHLYSLPEQPDAIPYVTSYYTARWGFCLSHNQREQLPKGKYHAVIKTKHFKGVLNYGELIIPGETDQEILLSTYVCHPSMANNELSGPVVTTYLSKWLQELKNRKYTYRVIFIPETIGSIVYIHQNLMSLQKKVIAGYVLTCVGDDRDYSFMPSRKANTLADYVALHTLEYHSKTFTHYSFLERGSDERQFCSPLVNLPVCSVMRSKYGTFPEYHTSLDDLNFVTPTGLSGALSVYQKILFSLEGNKIYRSTVYGEPQLGKRGLYPTLSTKGSGQTVRTMMNLIAYMDGEMDLLMIAKTIKASMLELFPMVDQLLQAGLIEEIHTQTIC